MSGHNFPEMIEKTINKNLTMKLYFLEYRTKSNQMQFIMTLLYICLPIYILISLTWFFFLSIRLTQTIFDIRLPHDRCNIKYNHDKKIKY